LKQFDLNEALDKAIDAFSELGYHATSLSRLTTAMEIAEGSLYKAFPDNRAVFLAAFERYVMLRGERLAQELAYARTGREKVGAVLAVYAECSHGKVRRRGCLLVGSAVDLASSDPEMAKRVATVLAGHERRLLDFIRQGQEDGSASSHTMPPSLPACCCAWCRACALWARQAGHARRWRASSIAR
jgi:AcrR family transcriptional regulator